MRPRRIAYALVLALAVASGAVTTAAASTAPPPSDPGGDGATFPTTIEHRYASTTFTEAPQRIVSIDDQWTDVLTAMGAPLVAAATTPLVEGGRYPWQDVIPDSVEPVPLTDAIPYEAVAAADPDPIVVTYQAIDQDVYDRLAAIAPTIGPLGDAEVDRWQDLATAAGEFLGEPSAASELIDAADAANAALRDELPGLDGLDYALANYVAGDAIYVVTDPDDGASQVFAELGMSIDPELLGLADGEAGRVELSLEQIGMLDSDLLLLLTNGTDPADIAGLDALPATQTGAFVVLDMSQAVGLNTPSPLSVPYSLDAIRPALEAAAGAPG